VNPILQQIIRKAAPVLIEAGRKPLADLLRWRGRKLREAGKMKPRRTDENTSETQS
jgi:hypothetical protein